MPDTLVSTEEESFKNLTSPGSVLHRVLNHAAGRSSRRGRPRLQALSRDQRLGSEPFERQLQDQSSNVTTPAGIVQTWTCQANRARRLRTEHDDLCSATSWSSNGHAANPRFVRLEVPANRE